MAESYNISDMEQYVIDKVRTLRKEKGVSQRDLAAVLETSNGFVGQAESPRHRAKYNLQHINEFAKFFKCSPKDFLPDKPF